MKADAKKLLNQAAMALEHAELDKAAKLYFKVYETQPDNMASLLGLGMILNLSGQGQKALEVLAKVWQRMERATQEENANVHGYTRAEVLAQMGLAMQIMDRIDEALALYKAAQELYPNEQLNLRIRNLETKHLNKHPIAHHLKKAKGFMENNQTALALQSFQNALKLNPDNDEALHGMGYLYCILGDLKQALSLVQHAIIMQPAIAEYQNTLGMVFMYKGEYDKARIFMRRAIDLDPNYVRAYNNLGIALKSLNRYDEALVAYKKALSLQPDMAETYNNIGNLLRITHDFAAAETALKKALELRPNYLEAQKNYTALLQEAAAANVSTVTLATNKPKAPTSNPVVGEKLKPKAGGKVEAVPAPKLKDGGKPAQKSKAGAKIQPKVAAKGVAKAKPTPKAAAKPKQKSKATVKAQSKPAAKGVAKAKPTPKAAAKPKQKSKATVKSKPKPNRK